MTPSARATFTPFLSVAAPISGDAPRATPSGLPTQLFVSLLGLSRHVSSQHARYSPSEVGQHKPARAAGTARRRKAGSGGCDESDRCGRQGGRESGSGSDLDRRLSSHGSCGYETQSKAEPRRFKPHKRLIARADERTVIHRHSRYNIMKAYQRSRKPRGYIP